MKHLMEDIAALAAFVSFAGAALIWTGHLSLFTG